MQESSSASGRSLNRHTSLAMIFTGIITALAFRAITVQFVVARVESYIIVAAGFIFVAHLTALFVSHNLKHPSGLDKELRRIV